LDAVTVVRDLAPKTRAANASHLNRRITVQLRLNPMLSLLKL